MINYISIGNVNAREVEVFTKLNENELKHYFEPEPDGIFIAETPTVVMRAINGGYEPLSLFIEDKYVNTEAADIISRCNEISERTGKDISVYTAPLEMSHGVDSLNVAAASAIAFYELFN